MNNLNIGNLITTTQQRDAIHMAVIPVTAGENLTPGDTIGIRPDGMAQSQEPEKAIGIADPFLRVCEIKEGQQFWLFLNPGTITSLRHMWEHPAFAPDKPVESSAQQIASKLWLEDFGKRNGFSWDRLMEIGNKVLTDTGSVWAGDEDDQETMDSNKTMFVFHVSTVLGKPPVNPYNVFFRCAC